MQTFESREQRRARRWPVVVARVMTIGMLVGPAAARGQDGDDVTRAARRVLARGYELPAGFTALAVTTKTVLMDLAGDGTPVARRRPAIRGAFVLGGQAISFETIRGGHLSRRWIDDGDPRYELDVCFRDDSGNPFLVQIGGDHLLDPSCAPEALEGSADPGTLVVAGPMEARERDFAAAAAALRALEGVAFRGRFAEEYGALMGHLRLASEGLGAAEPDCAAEDIVCEEDAPGAAGGLGTSTHQNSWRQFIEVFSGAVQYVPGATHGATVGGLQDPRNRQVSIAWHRCNHGRCYYDATMRFQCGFYSSFSRNDHVHQESCSTFYSPRSGADWWLPGHNSNDDTSIEYRAVRNNQHYPDGWGSGWPCNDPSTHNNTSSCY